MIVLGIESTCDETAASLVEDGRRLLKMCIRDRCPGEQHGHQGHRCKQGSESFPKFASKVLGCFHVSILSSQKSVSFTGVKYIILLLFCKQFCSHFLKFHTN